MSGIDYRKHPVKAGVSIVTGTRALGTIYRNTTGRPMLCFVTVLCTRTADGEAAIATAQVENVTPPTVSNAICGLRIGMITEAPEIIDTELSFAVPNGEYYRVVISINGGATVLLTTWVEVTL